MKPRFGDLIVNGWASMENPTRVGIFVRANKGSRELTDGSGKFWESSLHNHRLTVAPTPVLRDLQERKAGL